MDPCIPQSVALRVSGYNQRLLYFALIAHVVCANSHNIWLWFLFVPCPAAVTFCRSSSARCRLICKMNRDRLRVQYCFLIALVARFHIAIGQLCFCAPSYVRNIVILPIRSQSVDIIDIVFIPEPCGLCSHECIELGFLPRIISWATAKCTQCISVGPLVRRIIVGRRLFASKTRCNVSEESSQGRQTAAHYK